MWGKRQIKAEILERLRVGPEPITVTLYDWMARDVRDGRNLVATDRNGRELWRAKPVNYGDRTRQDSFVQIRLEGDTLIAQTFSSWRVSVDLADGSVTVLEFTK